MRIQNLRSSRRGATLVETAVVIGVFLMMILGMLDLGIAVFRHHVVSHAARQGARMAIVHGSLAPAEMGTWSPSAPGTPYTIKGDADDPIAKAMQPFLIGLNLPDVTITVTWLTTNEPDGSNRVQVDVRTPYQPMMTFIFGKIELDLHASSTMLMAH